MRLDAPFLISQPCSLLFVKLARSQFRRNPDFFACPAFKLVTSLCENCFASCGFLARTFFVLYTSHMPRWLKSLAVWTIVLSQSGFCCCAAMGEVQRHRTPENKSKSCCCRTPQQNGEGSGAPASPNRDRGRTCCECRQPRTIATRVSNDPLRELHAQPALTDHSIDGLLAQWAPFDNPNPQRQIQPLCPGERLAMLSVWLK